MDSSEEGVRNGANGRRVSSDLKVLYILRAQIIDFIPVFSHPNKDEFS